MRLKLNLSQKLLIITAAVLLTAGVGKLLYFYYLPLNPVVFGIDNLLKSAGYELDIEAAFRVDPSLRDSGSAVVEIINDMLVTAQYKKNREATNIDFTLNSRSNSAAVLRGTLYADSNRTALTIGDKTYFSGKIKPASQGLLNGLAEGLKNSKPGLRYQPGGGVMLIRDYGRPVYTEMDSFYFTLQGDQCGYYLNPIWNDSGISAFIKQDPIDSPVDSSAKINTVFQLDDFIRLRGIQSEIDLSGVSANININAAYVGKDISIITPDFMNGTDISSFSQDEINLLFKGLLDSLAGGK